MHISENLLPLAVSDDKHREATKKKKRSVEINNGRAAQMGILGLMTHEIMGNINDLPIIGH